MPGDRLHLQQGPIDLIIDIDAPGDEQRTAESRAEAAFDGLLAALASELKVLRQPVEADREPAGEVASRMHAIALRLSHYTDYLTPMATVAGAVADHVLAATVSGGKDIRRASVNNGGDIAIWLASGEEYRVGLVADIATGARAGEVRIQANMPTRGIATSGWPGRSLCRGIADAVTVLAADAAIADGAATLIAGAVNIDAAGTVERAPADTLDLDSDLRSLEVTVAVGKLTDDQRRKALASGRRLADAMLVDGMIDAAWLHLQGESVVVPLGAALTNWHDRSTKS